MNRRETFSTMIGGFFGFAIAKELPKLEKPKNKPETMVSSLDVGNYNLVQWMDSKGNCLAAIRSDGIMVYNNERT